ncbi:anti-FecI sigma factor, FecR [methanotrophic bacterial endosymbiont of Bathymodiolus sp.]|nr:anti-FecI sigma factor, FecR [methanotrophic bacterial endosymbiont of Bathymodiolus sp.]
MITEDLIVNFFEGKCDARDVAIVQAWFNENPAEVKRYLGEEEWESFQSTHVLSPELSGRLWNNVNMEGTPPRVRFRYFRWGAVAASLLLVVGLSWPFISKRQKAGPISAATIPPAKDISNGTPQKKTLTLSDGSTVELSPNSTISCPGDFNSAERNVVLKGEAEFNIAKDAARPFTVYSNSVKIIVLGTRFTVNSADANNATKVILHEGRVMVKIPDSSAQDNKNEYYLTPGDIFIFKKANRRSRTINPDPVATAKGISTDSLTARILHLEEDKDHCYLFNNYPLDVVFDQLQLIYNTKIIYNRAELGNRTFIGKIDRKDSLSHILKSITLLNQFGLRKQGDSLIIGN